jgi:hypothetical protein
MYCGNNRLDRRVIDGTLDIGTRYGCLRQGIGKGRLLDPYTEPYEPLFNETIYCGNKNRLPRGYDRFGSNIDCFRKGVGIGKARPLRRSRRSSSYLIIFNFPFVCFVLFILLLALFILSYKPS